MIEEVTTDQKTKTSPSLPMIEATVPCLEPPAWALLERFLFKIMNEAAFPYLEKYTRPDGTLIWGGTAVQHGRDDVDDFYEAFYNWPLAYLLGGADHLLELGLKEWDAVTKQLTEMGLLEREFERGADQFHQGESLIYFYLLCLADPKNPKLQDRAKRFAAFYTGEDPQAPNYDVERKVIRAPHNGSLGPRWGYLESDAFSWQGGMRVYGLPFEDVEGVHQFDNLKDPELARRMGAAMQERFGKGDVVANLAVTSLVTNAFLMTGEAKYRTWVLDYVDTWLERAKANGGLLPDNVGLSGMVGEYLNGKWYGGLYGWSWPHGFYNVGMAATVAGANAFLLTNDERYLELPRSQIDTILAKGEVRDVRGLEMSLAHHWLGQIEAKGGTLEAFVVPYRYKDSGWFDYQPVPPTLPTALWNLSQAAGDWERLEGLRQHDPVDWRRVFNARYKEDAGHEGPWLRFLAGDNPRYPETILSQSYGHVCRRLELLRRDTHNLTTITNDEVHHKVHLWQNVNPVLTEALVQLTLGAPQLIYNGGLLHAPLRYFDAERRRPGLPEDVAALVEKLEPHCVTLSLVNVSPFEVRDLIIQAGAFAEHTFTNVTYSKRTSEYPGGIWSYAAPKLELEKGMLEVQGSHLHVKLPPATTIHLELYTERFVNPPSYRSLWENER
jgi:hypothetical protein